MGLQCRRDLDVVGIAIAAVEVVVGRAVDVHAAVPDVSFALDRAPVHEDGMF